MPLHGLIHLAWGQEVAVEALGSQARLAELIRHRVLRPGPEDGVKLLELAGLPAVRFTRPRAIADLDAQLGQLLGSLPVS